MRSEKNLRFESQIGLLSGKASFQHYDIVYKIQLENYADC